VFFKKTIQKRVLSLELGVPVVLINVMHHTVCVKFSQQGEMTGLPWHSCFNPSFNANACQRTKRQQKSSTMVEGSGEGGSRSRQIVATVLERGIKAGQGNYPLYFDRKHEGFCGCKVKGACRGNAKSQLEAVIEHLVGGRANPGELRCTQCT